MEGLYEYSSEAKFTFPNLLGLYIKDVKIR